MGNMTHIYAVVFTKFITVILQTFFILAKILRQFMAKGSNIWECNYIVIYRVSYKFSFALVCHLDKLVKNEILSSPMSHHFFLISYYLYHLLNLLWNKIWPFSDDCFFFNLFIKWFYESSFHEFQIFFFWSPHNRLLFENQIRYIQKMQK